jgi:uncharacterized protein
MTLRNKIETDLHNAMRSNDDLAKNTIRMLLASVKLIEIDKHTTLEDQDILAVIQKEIKMRNETISELTASGRIDLLEKARLEIEFLNRYLPAQLTDEEILIAVKSCITEIGATNVKEMGLVMKAVLPKIGGRASTERISSIVRSCLS